MGNKIQLTRKFRQKLTFLAEQNLSAIKLRRLKSYFGGTQTRPMYTSCQVCKKIWHQHLLFILKGYFQKLVTCTNKAESIASKFDEKTVISSLKLEKTIIGTFVY